MTVLLLALIVVGAFAALVRYARHDRFAGPSNRHLDLDMDLGAASDRLVHQ